jgi:integrase
VASRPPLTRWEDVDWSQSMIFLPGTKTQKSTRWAPMHPVLREVLSRHPNRSGSVVGEWLNIRRDLEAACKRAKIDRISPNDLRRTLLRAPSEKPAA